ncbi:MAG: hypothetical protein ABIP35_01655 [Ginsengibacter sp.]
MKKSIFCVSVIIAMGCNSSKVETPNMPGTYFMSYQILDDGKNETKYTDLKQLKIYTDDYFMYVQVNPKDSVSAFGVGSYTTDTATVMEHVMFSASDSNTSSTPATYNLHITKTPDGYQQVIPEIVSNSIKYKLTELYENSGTATTSPLDGIWRELKSYTLEGSDTIKNNRIQYKAFYKGYFMFGHSFKNNTGKNHTGIGFGTFKTISDTKIQETDLNSTYSVIAGQTFDIDIKMDGNDKFMQVIIYADGSRGVEFYERIKKP